jgi:hypothetical protein
MDSQFRFGVSKQLFTQCNLDVPLGANVFFWGAIGEFGQVQLLPRESELSKARDSLDPSAGENEWDAGADPAVRLQRLLQTFLRIKCRTRTEDGKVEMKFYAEAVAQGHLDGARCEVVVTTTEKILEVWRKDNWRKFGRIPDLRRVNEEARDFLRRDR